ncbi:hypothetical protein [Acidocella aromatica]|uniref:Uncharacterized protein n=1 Tax=Acidocella aromatica TaxID=1303579 RepID=A0A840VLL8_9PROT|nr:hypothetical protein [Acidocella aromatica]MBB5374035.1 hypothetical protein [Acidocella aromatica]
MAQQLGDSRKTNNNGANHEFSAGAERMDVSPGLMKRCWLRFLAGPKVPPGPALVMILTLSLLLWAGLIWLVYRLFWL